MASITLASMVSKRRRELGLTLRELGARVTNPRNGQEGLSPQYLNDVEHGRRTPSRELILELGQALEMDSQMLLAAAGMVPSEVEDYLSSSPQVAPQVARVMRAAKAAEFSNWEEVEELIRSFKEKRRK